MNPEPKPDLDEFEVNFKEAIGDFADEMIQFYDKELEGKSDVERKQYFLSRALSAKEELITLDAPSFLIEQASQRIARLEREKEELRK